MIFDLLARHRHYRRAEAELDAMSDRELADLGVSRYDISRVVRGLPHR